MKAVYLCTLLFVCLIASESTHNVDNLIIGSGFGGSIAAHRLTQRGFKVTILEKGRHWDITDPTRNATFPLLLNPDERSAWFQNKTVAPGAFPYYGAPIDVGPGLMEEISSEVNPRDPGIRVRAVGVSVNNGVGVGGGSLIYNAAIVQPTKSNFYSIWNEQKWSGLYEELEREYWPKVTNMLKPKTIPNSILNSRYFENARVFQQQAHNAGFPDSSDWTKEPRHGLYKLPLAIDWNVVQQEIEGKVVPSSIGGEIWYGINSGAKFSLDRPGNYLRRALDTGLATIKALHVVNHIEYHSDTKLYEVQALILNESGAVIDQVQYNAKKVFMAAGSVMSTALLTRAKALQHLPNLNEHVGQLWGNNGDAFGFRFGSNTGINPGEGGPASFGMFYDDTPTGATVLMNIPVLWGPYLQLNNIIATLCMGIPKARGSFAYDATSDTVTLQWPHNPFPDQDAYNAAQSAFAALNNTNPGTSGTLDPIESAAAVTGHPQGGLVLGKATDMDCEVDGYNGLFVVDGSLVPGAAGAVNPSFVVAGVAERCMDRIIDNYFSDSNSNQNSNSNYSSSDASSLVTNTWILLSVIFTFFAFLN